MKLIIFYTATLVAGGFAFLEFVSSNIIHVGGVFIHCDVCV